MARRIGEEFVRWRPAAGGDEALRIVDSAARGCRSIAFGLTVEVPDRDYGVGGSPGKICPRTR